MKEPWTLAQKATLAATPRAGKGREGGDVAARATIKNGTTASICGRTASPGRISIRPDAILTATARIPARRPTQLRSIASELCWPAGWYSRCRGQYRVRPDADSARARGSAADAGGGAVLDRRTGGDISALATLASPWRGRQRRLLGQCPRLFHPCLRAARGGAGRGGLALPARRGRRSTTPARIAGRAVRSRPIG